MIKPPAFLCSVLMENRFRQKIKTAKRTAMAVSVVVAVLAAAVKTAMRKSRKWPPLLG